jgi:flagellar assembly factor FliW
VRPAGAGGVRELAGTRLVIVNERAQQRTPKSFRELRGPLETPCLPDDQGGNQEVNILTTRFGLIQACETDVFFVPEGLLGFRSFTQFVLVPDPVVTGLSWLQSVTAPELAFGLVAPLLAVSDYQIELRQGDRAALELDDERSALVYVILNRAEGGGLTVNLQGPLVFNPVRRLGRQLVLTSSRYPVRYPLDTYASAPAPTLLPGPTPLRATA